MHENGFLTVYNRVTDNDTDKVTWLRTVVACHWEDSVGKTSSAATSQKHDADVCVWLNAVDKKSVYPYEFEAASDPWNYLTFAAEDIVYHCQMDVDIPDNGQKEFMRKYPGAYIVKSADLCAYGPPAMQHWEISLGDRGGRVE